MKKINKLFRTIGLLAQRECKRLTAKSIYLFAMVLVPIGLAFFFTSLMDEGLPHDIPIGIVDLDNTYYSHLVSRNMDSFSSSEVIATYSNVTDARKAMQNLNIYGFIVVPRNFTKNVMSFKPTKLSYYSNQAYMIPGALVYKDMRMLTTLANGAAKREFLKARGKTEEEYMPILNPISVDFHSLNNPWMNYSIYLCNTVVPGLFILLIFMITVFAIGDEIKQGTANQLMEVSHQNTFVALFGKLLPHTIIFSIVFIAYNSYLYGILHFPCNSGMWPVIALSILTVLASQAMGIFMIATLRTLRFGLSFASLWGIVALSITGLSFPIESMHPSLQIVGRLFPLRHYLTIYYDQALNGYDIMYSLNAFAALAAFLLLPILVIKPLKSILTKSIYIP